MASLTQKENVQVSNEHLFQITMVCRSLSHVAVQLLSLPHGTTGERPRDARGFGGMRTGTAWEGGTAGIDRALTVNRKPHIWE